MDVNQILNTLLANATQFGLKALGALALWIVGRWLIGLAVSLMSRGLSNQKVDTTVIRYLASALNVVLNIALVVAILGYFGIETTTFAALLAAGGVAIGVAWGGLLQNFASGAFLVVLHPFKVGDFVTIGGVTGTVREIGLFATALDTMDNVRVIVGNGKIFSDTIYNFSANPVRRVDLVAQLNGGIDHNHAISLLRQKVAAIPNVAAEPAVLVEILEHNLVGPVLAVRPHTHTDHYWQVYFETNRVIRESLGAAGFPAPLPVYGIKNIG